MHNIAAQAPPENLPPLFTFFEPKESISSRIVFAVLRFRESNDTVYTNEIQRDTRIPSRADSRYFERICTLTHLGINFVIIQ